MATQISTPNDLAVLVHKRLNGAKISTPCPSEEILSLLFEIMFYASLKTEESQFIKVTITFIDPINPDPNPPSRIVADRWNHIAFEEKVLFNVKNLVKLSKAADPWSSSLAVYYNEEGELIIWGMIDQAIHYQSFLNYESDSGPEKPGLFQASITGIGNLTVMFDYELIANLKQSTLISNYKDVFNYGPISEILEKNVIGYRRKISSYLNDTYPDDDKRFWYNHLENIYKESLARILLRIQYYQHGGAVLITLKAGPDLSIKHKIRYDRLYKAIINNTIYTITNYNLSQTIHDDYLESSKKNMPINLYLEEAISDFEKEDTTSEIKGALRFISSLSCIDGLILLTPTLKVRGFGAVIEINEIPPIIYSSNTASINEAKLNPIESNHFGTRHQSMFSYCWNNIGSLGFVISQDSDIRAITRISDKLIMWENIKVQKFLRSEKLARPMLRRTKR